MTERVVVRRSALKMWLLALFGIPLLILGVDFLNERRLFDLAIEFLYTADDAPQPEGREVVWAWVFVVAGALLVGWGLKELVLPTKVVTADPDGLGLAIKAPFRRAVRIPWEYVRDVRAERVTDEEVELDVLVVELEPEHELPLQPWGARWLDPQTLAVFANDWEHAPDVVAERLRHPGRPT